MPFQCESCGSCCRSIGFSPKDLVKLEFPYRVENNVCEKLVDGKCSVYADRPAICRVDSMYDLKAELGMEMTREEYYSLSKQCCVVLREAIKNKS